MHTKHYQRENGASVHDEKSESVMALEAVVLHRVMGRLNETAFENITHMHLVFNLAVEVVTSQERLCHN